MDRRSPDALLAELLETVIKKDASDLHLSVGRPPILRVDGVLFALNEYSELARDDAEEIVRILTGNDRAVSTKLEIDLAYEHTSKNRFRVNIYHSQGRIAIAFRAIPGRIRTMEELHLPAELERFALPPQGFVLLTGPTGHGKTTTMASIVDIINHNRVAHIITIEDPIEYVYEEDRCLIHQREVGDDTESFGQALKMALREDPNVVVVGEMRDLESIATALTIAETGHLVFATLHTNDAAQTINRIVDVFPAVQQQQIRIQLAATLSGIVSLRLLPKKGGGRVPAVEVLVATPAVRNLIREGETAQIPGVVQTGAATGMIPLERSIRSLIEEDLVTPEDAAPYLSGEDVEASDIAGARPLRYTR